MMKVEKLTQIEVYQQASEFARIGQKAAQIAKTRLRSKGIPIVFSRNGKIFYEMPDGEITSKSPFI
jgi:hypothetical protein